MSYQFLKYNLDSAIATVTLNRPEDRNRIDGGLADELREVCREIREDPTVRVVCVTGEGEHFSVGRDAMLPEEEPYTLEERLQWVSRRRVASSVASLPVPVVMALNGDALDHGLELALAGDLRIAADSASLGITDLAQGGGRFPWDGGTQRLPRTIGPAWAQDMILTSRVINAAQALQLGLVNRVAAPGPAFAEAAQSLLHEVARGAPVAARYAREAVVQGLDLPLEAGLRLEADLNIILQSTDDRAEGLRSFMRKQPPSYTGR